MDLKIKLTCHLCEKTFSKLSNKNRHLKDVHKQEPLEGRSTKHIKCPLCTEQGKTSLATHDHLVKHLEDVHSLTICISLHHFENKEEFEAWRCMSDRNKDYVFERGSKTSNDEEYIYYNCNRSNTTGFVSNCTKRSMKKGGSIKISGLCPSRISVKVKSSGVEVKYIETHAGHNDVEYPLCIDEPSTSRAPNQIEVESFIEKTTESQKILSIDLNQKREIILDEIVLKLKSLDREKLVKIAEIFNQTFDRWQTEENQKGQKRKTEKQLYYPNKK